MKQSVTADSQPTGRVLINSAIIECQLEFSTKFTTSEFKLVRAINLVVCISVDELIKAAKAVVQLNCN